MITKPHYKFIMDITQIIYRNIQILLFSNPYPSIPFPVSIGLNLSGRGTLITSVLQTLPLYTFSCFKVLETISKRLDAIIGNFWWGHEQGVKKLHMIHWDKMCQNTRKIQLHEPSNDCKAISEDKP